MHSNGWQPVYMIRNRVVEPGQLHRTPNGWSESAPIECPQGHPLGPNQVTVSWISCPVPGERGGHRTHTCNQCRADGVENDTIYTPPRPDDCPCQEGTRAFGGASKPHMELHPIPHYEPPTDDEQAPTDVDPEQWAAWFGETKPPTDTDPSE